MALITLTRIFLLTHGQPTLIREVTTPHLSPFITTCLHVITRHTQESTSKVVDYQSPFLEIVLQCFIRLLPNHPASFRPFNTQIRRVLGSLLAPGPGVLQRGSELNPTLPTQKISRLSRQLHALLPLCAPKNGATEEWKSYLRLILKHIDRTANIAFRAIRETQPQSNHVYAANNDMAEDPGDSISDDLLLPGWQGLSAGIERISGLLSLLAAYLSTKGNFPYQIPIKPIHEMAERMLSITRPAATTSTSQEYNNRQISREERDALYMMIPKVHIATIELISVIIHRSSLVSTSFSEDLLEQITWMIRRSTSTTRLRIAVYKIVEQIVQLIGPSMTIVKMASIDHILRLACKDLNPQFQKIKPAKTNGTGQSIQHNADSFIAGSKTSNRKYIAPKLLRDQATQLLTTSTLRIPAVALAHVRLQLDGTAALLQDEKLHLASILNPQVGLKHQNTNMVPFLAAVGSQSPFMEALLHRRMAALVNQKTSQVPEADQSDSELEDEQTVVISASSMAQPKIRDFASTFNPSTTLAPAPAAAAAVHSSSALASVLAEKVEDASEPLKRGAMVLVTGKPDAQQDEDIHLTKRPKLDVGPEMLRTEMDKTLTDTNLPSSYMTANEENELYEASDSDASFEVPEIIMGTDSEGEEDVDDDKVKESHVSIT